MTKAKGRRDDVDAGGQGREGRDDGDGQWVEGQRSQQDLQGNPKLSTFKRHSFSCWGFPSCSGAFRADGPAHGVGLVDAAAVGSGVGGQNRFATG